MDQNVLIIFGGKNSNILTSWDIMVRKYLSTSFEDCTQEIKHKLVIGPFPISKILYFYVIYIKKDHIKHIKRDHRLKKDGPKMV